VEFIDTHTHIFLPQFEEDREQMIQRALDRKVTTMLLPNIDRSTVEDMNRLASMHPDSLHPMMGLHPCSVKLDGFQDDLKWMGSELESGKYIAIGETGIDLYWDKSTFQEQAESFRQHVTWSIEFDLPLVIHARESFNEIFEILDEMNDERLKGIFHCFTGGREEADKILSFGGFKMGLGGVLTYKNSGLKETVRHYALEHFVLETDAPYLTPVPYRGKRNEPSYIPFVAEQLAGATGEGIDLIAEVTTANAKELFKLN
jgi:TatD DNase family protein